MMRRAFPLSAAVVSMIVACSKVADPIVADSGGAETDAVVADTATDSFFDAALDVFEADSYATDTSTALDVGPDSTVTDGDGADGDGAADSETAASDSCAFVGESATPYCYDAAFVCPPPSDPYWTSVFSGAWGDAPVCGVIKPGQVDVPAEVNAELAAALTAHPEAKSACPKGICVTWSAYMGDPCNAPSGGPPYFTGCGVGGRRPAKLEPFHSKGGSRVGAHLAHQSALEAASVQAFAELAEDLHALGASQALVGACRRAASEEVVHARITERMANEFGADVVSPPASASERRTLRTLAVDNAVEGLVRETLAAAVAVYQANHAAPELRAPLARIARDELSHAALSHRIHEWAWEQLDDSSRAQVDRAMDEAIHRLRAELEDVEAMPAIGWPSAVQSAAIQTALAQTLWA